MSEIFGGIKFIISDDDVPPNTILVKDRGKTVGAIVNLPDPAAEIAFLRQRVAELEQQLAACEASRARLAADVRAAAEVMSSWLFDRFKVGAIFDWFDICECLRLAGVVADDKPTALGRRLIERGESDDAR